MKRRKELREKLASGAISLVILLLFVQTLIFLIQPADITASHETTEKKTTAVKEESVAPVVISEPENGDISLDYHRINAKNRSASRDRDGQKFFRFDPNTISKDSLVMLGLSEKQAMVVIKYRTSGGYFNAPEEFNKIYVLPDGFYEKIKDSIYIDERYQGKEIYQQSESKGLTDLNSAAKEDLMSLPGIGEYYASKILEYRDKTGGFADKKELLNIYGIDSLKYSGLHNMVYADISNIRVRDIGALSYEELCDHPYIGYYLARGIFRMRETKGEKTLNLALLLAGNIISEEMMQKLKYYFR